MINEVLWVKATTCKTDLNYTHHSFITVTPFALYHNSKYSWMSNPTGNLHWSRQREKQIIYGIPPLLSTKQWMYSSSVSVKVSWVSSLLFEHFWPCSLTSDTHSEKHGFSQTWQQAKINNLPSECRQNRKKSKTETRPSSTHSQAISEWLAEILIVRMHHVVWKQNQIRADHPSSLTPVQRRVAFLIRVSFIYFRWLWFQGRVTPTWGTNRWHCMDR